MVQRSKGIFFTKFGQKGKSFSSDGTGQTFSFVPVDNRALLFSQGAMTRSSEASWFYTSSGEMTWWPENTVRETKEFTPEGYPYFVIEGERVNFLLRTEEIENGWTSSSAQVAADLILAPDGELDADYVYYTAFDGNVRRSFSGQEYEDWCVSAFAVTSSATKEFRLGFLKRDITIDYSHHTASINWGRFDYSVNILSGTANPQFRFLNSGTFNEGVFLWGAQAETGSFPTSYIRNTTVLNTREADNLSFSEAGSWVNEPWHFYFKPESGTDDVGILQNLVTINSTNPDYVRLTAERNRIQVGSGGVIVCDTSASLTISRFDEIKIILDPISGTLKIEGATGGNGTYIGVPWAWRVNQKIQFGASNNVTGPFYGLLSEPISLSTPTTTLIGESGFTGSNHYTRHDDNTYLEGGTSMFRAVMFRVDQAPPYGGSVYLWSKAWTLRCTTGGVLTAQLSDGGANAVACSASVFTSVDVGKTFLATFSFDGDEMTLYLNGVEQQLAISTVNGFTGNSRKIVLAAFDNGLGDILQHGFPFTIIGAAATDTSISIGMTPMDYYLACSGAGDILPFANCQHLYSKKRSGNLGFDRITGAHLALTGTLKTQGPFVPTYYG